MIKNSMLSYGIVARFLHWTVATLFLSAYCAVYYRHWLTEAKTMENADSVASASVVRHHDFCICSVAGDLDFL